MLEADRLDDITRTAVRLHDARLRAAAFHDPDRIWDETRDWYGGLAPRSDTPPLDRAEHLKLALSVQQRLIKAGILPPEEMH